jgi:hypothetical protein
MTFTELRLCAAIAKAELGGGDRPTHMKRKEAAGLVMASYLDLFDDSYFPFSIDDVAEWSQRYRKGGEELRIKVQIAMTHGFRCPFQNRGKGPCSVEAEAGHIVQSSRGGPLSVENCWIECRAHNNQRRDMSIEEYLKSDKRTIDQNDAGASALSVQETSDFVKKNEKEREALV